MHKSLYFIGVGGAIIILLLVIIMILVLATIREYYYNKVNVLVDLDSPDIGPSLPPRQSTLETADELLHTMDTKQVRDNPLHDDGSTTEKEYIYDEELKGAD